MATPVSVCVLADIWNDYSDGFMTSAACLSGASFPVHCVLAHGFYTTAPISYWIMGTSGLLGGMSEFTSGVAVHSNFPEVVAALVVDCGSGWFMAGFTGVDTFRAVFPLVVDRPQLLGVLVRLDQKDSYP